MGHGRGVEVNHNASSCLWFSKACLKEMCASALRAQGQPHSCATEGADMLQLGQLGHCCNTAQPPIARSCGRDWP